MMREFLETYFQAINLDDKHYNCYFNDGVKRADFLLFDKQVVCEVKEIKTVNVQNKAEKLSRKKDLSEQDLKRDLYDSIEKALSGANKQIRDTKQALNLPSSLGLIIVENAIPEDLSILSLIDAANRKMMGGLVNTDCILCLDFVNTFSNPEEKQFRPVQVVLRDTEQAEKLSEFLYELIRDFCSQSATPLFEDWIIEKGTQNWFIDSNGKYKSYTAKIDFKLPAVEKTYNWRQRLAYFLNRWWWIIPLPFVYYDWFVR